MKSSDATPSHTVVRYEPLITVVMCELIVVGYSNTSVMHSECSTKVFMEEQLTSSAYLMESKRRVCLSKCRACLLKLLPQVVKVKEWVLNSTKLMKLRPTDPLQTTFAT